MEKEVFRLISVVDGEGLVVDADIIDSDIMSNDIRFYNVVNGVVGAPVEVSDFVKICFYRRVLKLYNDIELISSEDGQTLKPE
jgi:hypothetical protein